jgi:hypothetical protein
MGFLSGRSQIVEGFFNTRTDTLGWRMRHEAHYLSPQYELHSLNYEETINAVSGGRRRETSRHNRRRERR